MSLEERTLVVRNLEGRVTKDILAELFTQAGPVVNVVLRVESGFAYIEFEHKASVPFALALMRDVMLFGRELSLQPRCQHDHYYYQHVQAMDQFEHVMRGNPDHFLQFMPEDQRPRSRAPDVRQHHNGHHRYSDGHQQYDRQSEYRPHPYAPQHQYNQYEHYRQQQSHNYQRRHSYSPHNDRKRHHQW